jgi:hypothetical protein
MRAINSAESGYAASAAESNYAVRLSIRDALPGRHGGFISRPGERPSAKSGYIVALSAGTAVPGSADCNGAPTRAGYYLTAVPTSTGMTGHRGFASSSTGVIYFDASGVPPTEGSMVPGGGGLVIQ